MCPHALTACPAFGLLSGIGLALCQRLLTVDEELHLCLACRNMAKAEAVRSSLLASHRSAQVSIVQVDVASLPSVLRAAEELKQRFVSGFFFSFHT